MEKVAGHSAPAITCASCEACCCRLEVMLMAEDEVPQEFTLQDRWGGWVMLRLDDGWCAALDRSNMRCTIYEHRPLICAEFPAGASECIDERVRFLK